MDAVQVSLDTFSNGFNCSQSVFSTFSEELGLDKETSFKISSCFGGGMRCGAVCGAVTGALMAIGLKYGYYKPNDAEGKEKAFDKNSEFMAKFIEKNGSIICKELLGYDVSLPGNMEKIRDLNLFKNVCPKVIADATSITRDMI